MSICLYLMSICLSLLSICLSLLSITYIVYLSITTVFLSITFVDLSITIVYLSITIVYMSITIVYLSIHLSYLTFYLSSLSLQLFILKKKKNKVGNFLVVKQYNLLTFVFCDFLSIFPKNYEIRVEGTLKLIVRWFYNFLQWRTIWSRTGTSWKKVKYCLFSSQSSIISLFSSRREHAVCYKILLIVFGKIVASNIAQMKNKNCINSFHDVNCGSSFCYR